MFEERYHTTKAAVVGLYGTIQVKMPLHFLYCRSENMVVYIFETNIWHADRFISQPGRFIFTQSLGYLYSYTQHIFEFKNKIVWKLGFFVMCTEVGFKVGRNYTH